VPVVQAQSEDEMRNLYKLLGLSEVTTEAAILMRRKNPVVEDRTRFCEKLKHANKPKKI